MTGEVTVGYVHDVEVAYSWHQSFVGLLMFDQAHEQRLIRGGFVAMKCGTDGLPAARNKTVEGFLDRDAEWLWWVDTDMGFDPDTVDRLVAAADPTERPIMGGLCFAQREMSIDGMGGFACRAAPTLYDWVSTEDGRSGFMGRRVYPQGVTRVSGTGSACILIHRSVFETIGGDWYTRLTNPSDGSMIAEDLSFCARAAQAGIPVHVDTTVKTSHLKHLWLCEADYLEQQQAAPKVQVLDLLDPAA